MIKLRSLFVVSVFSIGVFIGLTSVVSAQQIFPIATWTQSPSTLQYPYTTGVTVTWTMPDGMVTEVVQGTTTDSIGTPIGTWCPEPFLSALAHFQAFTGDVNGTSLQLISASPSMQFYQSGVGGDLTTWVIPGSVPTTAVPVPFGIYDQPDSYEVTYYIPPEVLPACNAQGETGLVRAAVLIDPEGEADCWVTANGMGQVTGFGGDDELQANFACESVGSIMGNVSADTDGDNVPDFPIQNVILELLDMNGNPVLDPSGLPITTTTDANGDFMFDRIPAGDYQVRQRQPAGYNDQSEADGGDDSDHPDDGVSNNIPVTVGAGENDTGNNFVEQLEPTVVSLNSNSAGHLSSSLIIVFAFIGSVLLTFIVAVKRR